MALVPDWKEAPTWFSMHIAAIIGVLNALQATVPYVQDLLTPTQLAAANGLLAVALIWARLIQQTPRA